MRIDILSRAEQMMLDVCEKSYKDWGGNGPPPTQLVALLPKLHACVLARMKHDKDDFSSLPPAEQLLQLKRAELMLLEQMDRVSEATN